jgi:hypothetical protein
MRFCHPHNSPRFRDLPRFGLMNEKPEKRLGSGSREKQSRLAPIERRTPSDHYHEDATSISVGFQKG